MHTEYNLGRAEFELHRFSCCLLVAIVSQYLPFIFLPHFATPSQGCAWLGFFGWLGSDSCDNSGDSTSTQLNILLFLIDLTRAPLGYFYNAPHWGGGLFRAPPSDLRNYWTDSKNSSGIWKPWKTVEGKQILLTSGSRVTSQVRSKSKCSTFRAWWHRRAKLRC